MELNTFEQTEHPHWALRSGMCIGSSVPSRRGLKSSLLGHSTNPVFSAGVALRFELVRRCCQENISIAFRLAPVSPPALARVVIRRYLGVLSTPAPVVPSHE